MKLQLICQAVFGGGMRTLYLWVQDQIPHRYLSLACCLLKDHCASVWLKAARMWPWHLPGLRERDNSLKFLLAALEGEDKCSVLPQ